MPRDPNIQTFSVRITNAQRGKLEKIAKENGLEISQLIRFAVDAMIRYVDVHEGVVHLPIDFTKHWESTPFIEPVTKRPSIQHNPASTRKKASGER